MLDYVTSSVIIFSVMTLNLMWFEDNSVCGVVRRTKDNVQYKDYNLCHLLSGRESAMQFSQLWDSGTFTEKIHKYFSKPVVWTFIFTKVIWTEKFTRCWLKRGIKQYTTDPRILCRIILCETDRRRQRLQFHILLSFRATHFLNLLPKVQTRLAIC